MNEPFIICKLHHLRQGILFLWLPFFSSRVNCRWQLCRLLPLHALLRGFKVVSLGSVLAPKNRFSSLPHFSSLTKILILQYIALIQLPGRDSLQYHYSNNEGRDWWLIHTLPGEIHMKHVLIWPKWHNSNDGTAGCVINSRGSYLGPGRILKFSQNWSANNCLSRLHRRPGLPSWLTFGHVVHNSHQDCDCWDIMYTADASNMGEV